MIEKALRFIVGMVEPHFYQDDYGREYSDKNLTRVMKDADVKPLHLTTLDSLVDYITTKYDDIHGKIYIHVESQESVKLYEPVDRNEDYLRRMFASVSPDIPKFPFGKFLPVEEFIINVKSMFMPFKPDGEEVFGRDDMLRYAGNIQNGTTHTCHDDGVSQHAVIKTGIVSTEDVLAPSTVVLKPFRTFLEVDQPESEFLFRIKDDGRGGVSCALFESDGFLWKMEAKRRIAEYLKEALNNVDPDKRNSNAPEVTILK